MPATLVQTPSNLQLIRVLRVLFSKQAREISSRVTMQAIEGGGTAHFDLSHWLPTMVDALRPTMLRHFRVGMVKSAHNQSKQLSSRNVPTVARIDRHLTRLQLKTPKKIGMNFDLYNPAIIEAVDDLVLKFCKETNATAVDGVVKARTKLRRLLKRGLKEGAAVATFQQRIRKIFTDPFRAWRIAATEPSRAVYAGQIMAAKETGLVRKKRWNASADACENCLKLDMVERNLDDPFVVLPKGGPYAVIYHPPYHPFCFCDLTEVL